MWEIVEIMCYFVIFIFVLEGGYMVFFVDIFEVLIQGEIVVEVMEVVKDVLLIVFDFYFEDNEFIFLFLLLNSYDYFIEVFLSVVFKVLLLNVFL